MLSVCIIVKNDEKNIERCLKSVSEYDFEVIVVDTGSSDKTKSIAKKYTDKLYEFQWCDDFSKARNYAIRKARNPYVMMLDSDEFVEHFEKSELEAAIMKHPRAVGRVQRKNIITKQGQKQETWEWINRIFPKDAYEYEGKIHEQIIALDKREYDTYITPISMIHNGYDLSDEKKKEKAQRNARLLQQELDELEHSLNDKEERKETQKEVQEKIPYVIYQLGKSAYMAQDYKKACEYFDKGLSYDLNPKLEYVIDMVETYGYALLNTWQAEKALFFENIYEEFGNCADFQFLMGLIYMNNTMFEKAVDEFLKATKHQECRSQGVNSYLAFYNVGVIYECLDKKEMAKKYYNMAQGYKPAQERLLRL